MFLITDDVWSVKKTKHKGLGVFAQKCIIAGTVLGDYLGNVISIADYDVTLDKHGLYLLYYSDSIAIYPDLNKPGMHLFNHSCSPNCWMYIYRGHTLFFALKNIYPGEELTIHYLLSPIDETCIPCPHICKCQSSNCTGTMHLSKEKYALWRQFQNNEKKKSKRARAVIGAILEPLPSYPTFIPLNPVYATICS